MTNEYAKAESGFDGEGLDIGAFPGGNWFLPIRTYSYMPHQSIRQSIVTRIGPQVFMTSCFRTTRSI